MCQASGKAHEEAGRDEPAVPSTHSGVQSRRLFTQWPGCRVDAVSETPAMCSKEDQSRAWGAPSQGNQGRLHGRGHTQATPCKVNVDTGKTQPGVPGVANNTSRGPKVGKWKECVGKDKLFDWSRACWVVKGTVGNEIVRVIKTTANVSSHHSRGADYGPGSSQSLCTDELL